MDKNSLPVSVKPVRRRVQIFFTEPSLTKQQFKDEADINKIIAKYKKTGMPTNYLNNREPVYRDVSSVPSYQEALDVVRTAQDTFMAMPSNVRSRFDNDPAKLLAFLQDPANAEEGVKLGLLQVGGVPVPKTGDTPLESKDKALPVDSGKPS